MKKTLLAFLALTVFAASAPFVQDAYTVLGQRTVLPSAAPMGAMVFVPDAGPMHFDGSRWVLSTTVTNNISAPRGALTLSSDAGADAADVVVKVGSTVANASVNNSAKLLSVRTGLNGTESEKAYVTKLGDMLLFGNLTFERDLLDKGTSGFGPRLLSRASSGGVMWTMDGFTSFFAGSLFIISNFGAQRVAFNFAGRMDLYGTNSTGTPGAATIDRPSGISSLANGQTSVVITNSLIPNPATTRVRISVTFHADPVGRYWVVQNNGSFTVNISAAAGADLPFSWEVNGLL